jgi:EpsI family protein
MKKNMFGRSLVLFACLVAAAGVVARADRREPVPIRETLDRFPTTIGEWKGVQQAPFAKDVLAVLGVDDYLTRAYFTPDRAGVGVYIGYYQSQRQGDTMHSPLNCLPGAGWLPVSKSALNIQVARSIEGAMRDIEVNRYVIEKGLDRQLVLYWYQAHDRVVASEYWGKFYLVADAMRMNRTDGSLVRVIAPFNGKESTEAAAEGSAVRFVKAMFPLLSDYLPS